jgi:phosphatidylinositol alpha-1,6-mannosyltransferase
MWYKTQVNVLTGRYYYKGHRVHPYIVTVHGIEILPQNLRGFRRKAYNEALHNAVAIHANSTYTKQLIIKTYPTINPSSIIVINPSISLQNNPVTNKSKKNSYKFTIGTLTRLVKRKNVNRIITSLSMLHEQGYDFLFLLAGDGPEKASIIQHLYNVKFEWQYLGAIKDDEKHNFFSRIDIFALPPLELANDVEGFGIVFLEANSYGVPVVASRTGGVPDAVKEGFSGIFVDPESPKDIADGIKNLLLSDFNYHESSQKWAYRFRHNNAAKSYDKLYKDILRSS